MVRKNVPKASWKLIISAVGITRGALS